MLKSLRLGLSVLLGIAEEANDVFMLVLPANWYFAVTGVTSTRPFNQHFLLDIGLIFVFIGGLQTLSKEAFAPTGLILPGYLYGKTNLHFATNHHSGIRR